MRCLHSASGTDKSSDTQLRACTQLTFATSPVTARPCTWLQALPTTRKMAQSGADRARPGLGRRRAHAPVAAGGDKYGQVKERAFEGAEDAKERVQENGLVQRLVAAHKELTGSGVSVSKVGSDYV